jgi:hypothetical protein
VDAELRLCDNAIKGESKRLDLGKGVNAVWKKGGHPSLPHSTALLKAENRLLQLSAKISFPFASSSSSCFTAATADEPGAVDEGEVNGMGMGDGKGALEHIWWCIPSEWKRTLVEGFCTVRYLHSRSGSSAGGDPSEALDGT